VTLLPLQLFTNDFEYHATNTVTYLDLSSSDFVTAPTVMFIIDKFLLLETLVLEEAPKVDPRELLRLLDIMRKVPRYSNHFN
jgi:hypothetical protein